MTFATADLEQKPPNHRPEAQHPGPPSAPQNSLLSLHVGMGWPDEQPGGLNRMVAGLVRHLPAAGVETQALVVGSSEIDRRSDGQVITFARARDPLPLRVWRARQALGDAIGRFSPDLVALHFALFGCLARNVLRDTPLVVHFHGPWADEGVVEGDRATARRVKHWVEARAYRGARRFITLSQAFARVLERQYGVDGSLIRVVPGGVDVHRFRPVLSRAEARGMAGLPTDRPTVLAVRRLARRMGLQNLIAEFAQVQRRVPEALLVIAGGGPMRDALAAQIEVLGLGESVRLLGRVSDDILPMLYRAADLSVVPSTALEGFGLTAVESLAAGTPTLVAPVGGLPEVVRELSEALIVDPTVAGSLADRIVAMLRGDQVLPTPEACAAYAAERFAWPKVALQTRAVYREALA